MASLATPTTDGLTVQSSKTLHIGSHQTVTLEPGVYNGGIKIGGHANVTLAPGEYYLNGGGLKIKGHAGVSGNGVMIYNASSKPQDKINLSGGAELNLTPMTTGTWAGISIFQDRASSNDITVAGHAWLDVHGSIYAGSAKMEISDAGNVEMFGSSLIADKLDVLGRAELTA